MRRDCDDGDVTLVRSITPEDTVRAGYLVLDISLENFTRGFKRMIEGIILVCLKARVAGIGQEKMDGLMHLLEQALLFGGFCLARLLPRFVT